MIPMESARSAGRIIGVLLLVHMAGSGIVNFFLEKPLSAAPGFLFNASANARQIAFAVLLGFVTELLWVAIAITAFPLFFQLSQRMALWLVVLALASFGVAVVENIGVLSMVSASETYVKASLAEREQLAGIEAVVRSIRDWPASSAASSSAVQPLFSTSCFFVSRWFREHWLHLVSSLRR